MHAVAILFLWVCVGATALAETPLPCQSPNMTGRLSVSQLGMNVELKAHGKYSYDSLAKKLHFKTVENMNASLDMDLLMLFEEGVFFEINNKNQSCEKKALHSLSHAFAIPSGVQYQCELVVGSETVPSEGLKVNMWNAEVPETKSRLSMFTTDGCLPVSVLYFHDSVSLAFSNLYVVSGVTNPEDFTLPSFCEGLTLEEAPEGTVHTFWNLFD